MTFASCLALSGHVPVITLLRLAIKQSVIARRPQILSFFSLCCTQFDFFPLCGKKICTRRRWVYEYNPDPRKQKYQHSILKYGFPTIEENEFYKGANPHSHSKELCVGKYTYFLAVFQLSSLVE